VPKIDSTPAGAQGLPTAKTWLAGRKNRERQRISYVSSRRKRCHIVPLSFIAVGYAVVRKSPFGDVEKHEKVLKNTERAAVEEHSLRSITEVPFDPFQCKFFNRLDVRFVDSFSSSFVLCLC